MEISKLKEEVKRLEGELRSRDQGMETLMVEMADLVDQVMNWEVEAIATRDSLNEVKLSRGIDIANAIDEALAKFKSSDESTALLKKDHALDSTPGWRLSSIISRHTIGIWIILS